MAIQDYISYGLKESTLPGAPAYSVTGYVPGAEDASWAPHALGDISQYEIGGKYGPYSTAGGGPLLHGGAQVEAGLAPEHAEYFTQGFNPYEYLEDYGWHGLKPAEDLLTEYEEGLGMGGYTETQYKRDVTGARSGWLAGAGILPHEGLSGISLPDSIEGEEELLTLGEIGAAGEQTKGYTAAKDVRTLGIEGLGSVGEFGEAGGTEYEIAGTGTGQAGGFQQAYEQALLGQAGQREQLETGMETERKRHQEDIKSITETGKKSYEPIVKAGGLAAKPAGLGVAEETQRQLLKRGGLSIEEQQEKEQEIYARETGKYETDLSNVAKAEQSAESDFSANLEGLGFVKEEDGSWKLPDVEEGDVAEASSTLGGLQSAYEASEASADTTYEKSIGDLNNAYRDALSRGDSAEAESVQYSIDELHSSHRAYKDELRGEAQELQSDATERIYLGGTKPMEVKAGGWDAYTGHGTANPGSTDYIPGTRTWATDDMTYINEETGQVFRYDDPWGRFGRGNWIHDRWIK